MIMTNRKWNFNAGPAVMPTEVLEEARENLLSLGDSGVGVMEHSHRGKEFVAILEEAEALVRELLGLDDSWGVIFTSGGASSQFVEVPMNLLKGGTANYVDTGSWSAKAIKEAQRYGTAHVAASSKDTNYTYIPKEFDFKADAAYTHITTNNTIFGTQYHGEPDSPALLVADASSDILSRPIDMSKYGLIYAGAQKNLGPAGVTLVVVRKEWAEKADKDIPTILQYQTHIEKDSCYNTPPTFPIYMMKLVLQWIKKQGGLQAMAKHTEDKANVLYDCLDGSDFWTRPVAKDSRSLMNVVFRLPSEELEKKLIDEATAAGFHGLKGHRSVGGLRASIYNAMEIEGVKGLVDFMKAFEQKNG